MKLNFNEFIDEDTPASTREPNSKQPTARGISTRRDDYDTNKTANNQDLSMKEEYLEIETLLVQERPDSNTDIIIRILKVAIPNILSNLVFYLQDMINIYFIAQLGEPSTLAALGLGNMVNNCFGLSILRSVNATMEILVSQAVGAGLYNIAGV